MSESNMHYYSKIVTASWLRRIIGKKQKGMNNIDLECLEKKIKPMFDIYVEYPVCLDNKTKKIVGIKCDDDGYSSNNSDGSCQIWKEWFEQNSEYSVKAKSKVPTKSELKSYTMSGDENRLTLLYFFDIGIVDEGRLKYAFEMEYKHPIDAKKIKFVEKHKINTFEVSAEWTMSRMLGILPKEIELKRKFISQN